MKNIFRKAFNGETHATHDKIKNTSQQTTEKEEKGEKNKEIKYIKQTEQETINKKRTEKTGQKRKKITTNKKDRKYLKGNTKSFRPILLSCK